MAQKIDVREQVRARLSRPLEGAEIRRIVIWHDTDGSFETEFDDLTAEGLDSPRGVVCEKILDNNNFALKRRIYRTDADKDFLLYSRSQKDLSARGLENDWLADLEFIADHFQADFASMLMDDLNAVDEAVKGVEQFKTFFNAQERKEKFKKLMPAAQTWQDVALGVIGVLLGASELSTECLTRTYLCQLVADKDPLETLGKFGADAAFVSFVSKRLGYEGDLTSLQDFSAHVLLTAVSYQLSDDALDGLESRISKPHGQFCLNVVHDWMADDSTADVLYDLCRRAENLCNLRQRFEQMNPSQLGDADVFPCINECVLTNLLNGLGHGADRAEEASRLLQQRKDLCWFSRIAPYFSVLGAAVDATRFYRDHIEAFHYAIPADIWKAYTTDWFHMDTAYRDFCVAYDDCQKCTSDVPAALDESLGVVAGWMERIYVNWFLKDSNACWVTASENAWLQDGYVEGVSRQRRFFDEWVIAGSADVKKTMVIVSDALRYEVAAELRDRLERDTRGTAELGSMQSVFPSITEFGMAALLPHTSLSYSEDDHCVYVNQNMPTISTADREKILQLRKPQSRCIQSKDLIAEKRSARKDLVGDAEFVYIYHNTIDAIGETYSTEHKVFDACEQAIDEIVALVKIATGDLSFTRIVITADHGFLYTRDPLDERDKVSSKDISGSTVKLGRRYAISGEEWMEDALFITMNMDDINGGIYTGMAPRECIRIKKSGPGENYVHGGVSLQECCVPVIQFRNKRVGAKGYEEQRQATLQLLSTQRRITSMIFKVELFQKEPVGSKVLPAEYELVMTDVSGNEVSNAARAHADMQNTDETARVSRLQFSLKAGRSYDAKRPYYLVCRNKESGQIVWKEEYQIDIAFVAMDDFGF